MTIYDDAVSAGNNAARAFVENALAEREAATADALTKVQDLTLQVTDLTKKLADCTAANNTLTGNVKAVTDTNAALNKTITDLNVKITALTAQITDLNNQIAVLKAQAPSNPPVVTPPATKTVFGACPTNPGGTTYAAAMTVPTKFGGKPSIRQFMGSALTWAGVPSGAMMHRSYKPAATVTDAEIDALLRAADADAVKQGVPFHILTFNHEPDNDGLSATARADMIKKINRLYERKVALGLKNVKVSVVFTGGFFASYGTQANRDLWKDVKGDLLGLDADGVHTADTASDYTTNYDDEVANVKKFMADNKANGWTGWTVPEFGTSRRTSFDPDGKKRAAWITKWGNYFAANGAVAVMWYDYGLTSTSDVVVNPSPEYDAVKALIAKN